MGVGQSDKARLVGYYTLAVDCVATDRLRSAIKTQQAKRRTLDERHTGDVNSWQGEQLLP